MPAFNAHPGRGPGGSTAGPTDDSPASPGDGTAAARSVVDIVNHLFARFDVDGDAPITLSEWLGVVDPDGDNVDDSKRTDAGSSALKTLDSNGDGALGKAEVTSAVGALDSNQDGQITRTERMSAHADATLSGVDALLGGARHGGRADDHGDHPATAPVVIADAVPAYFTTFDSDDSGTIAVSELLAALDARGAHADAPARLTAAVAKIDGNADGALDTAELTAALTAADANHDGSVGRGELGHGPGQEVGLIGVLLPHVDLPDVG